MAGSNQYCAWHECGQLICEMYENGLIVTIDVKGDRLCTLIFEGKQIGWCFEAPFRCNNLDNKAPCICIYVMRLVEKMIL